MEIRWAELGDLHELYKLAKGDGETHARPLDQYPLAHWIMSHEQILLVARDNAKIVGLILVRRKGDEANIDFLAVRKELKITAGIEEALITEAERMLGSATLILYVPKQRKKTVDYYTGIGFRVQDELQHIYGRGKHAVKLQKQAGTGAVLIAAGVRKPDSALQENLQRLEEAVQKRDNVMDASQFIDPKKMKRGDVIYPKH